MRSCWVHNNSLAQLSIFVVVGYRCAIAMFSWKTRLASYRRMKLDWLSCAKESDVMGELGIHRWSWMIWLSM